MTIQRHPALDGWFSLDPEKPALLGTQCDQCQTYYFPKQNFFCRNPACASESFNPVELSRHGTVWSYTSAHYQPPAPYIDPNDNFQPFTIAAIKLDKENMIILGQMISGVSTADLNIGDPVELAIETLHHSTNESGQLIEKLIWKWKPQ